MGKCGSSQTSKNAQKNKSKLIISNSSMKFYGQEADQKAKIVLLGDVEVGKTALSERLVNGTYQSENYQATIGGIFHNKQIQLKNQEYLSIDIWDTAGGEQYRSMLDMYYRNAQGVILVYDVSNRASYNSLKEWTIQLNQQLVLENIVLAIAGNKCDLDQQKVSLLEAQKFAKEHNAIYMQTSAKTGKNSKQLLEELCEQIYTKFFEKKI